MTRIAQAIEANVPAHIAYEQLRRFESYPAFMHGIVSVRKMDETRLHWAARVQDKDMEWDAEITEQLPDRCIAWRNISGPQNAVRIELQTVDQQRARVSVTMDCEPARITGAADGDAEAVLQRQLAEELARFKDMVEAQRTSQQGNAQSSSPLQADQSTRSSASLSQQEAEGDSQGVFSVAEEQSFDEQSAQARRVGQMPQDTGVAGLQEAQETDPSSAVAKSMKSMKPSEKR